MPPVGRSTNAQRTEEERAVDTADNEAHFPHNQIMSRKDVARLLGASQSTVDRMTRRGELPKKRQISSGRVGWLASEIQEVVQNFKRKP